MCGLMHEVLGRFRKHNDATSRRDVPRYGLGATSGKSGSRQRLTFTT